MLAVLVAVIVAQAPSPSVATVAQGSSSSVDEPRQVVARTPAEWEAIWKSHAGAQALPAVDFSTSMVAAVFLGTRPTGGFRVDIEGTRQEAGVLVIDYVERAPGADTIVTQVLTSPFHIVRIPRNDGATRFRRVFR